MVPPNHLLHFYAKRFLKRIELYLLLSGLFVFLTATQTSHHGISVSHKLKAAPEVDSLINFALSLQGVPYRYGGKNPAGFDCSGFTGYVFRHFGINLQASSRHQFSQGQTVEADSIQKGDLVFFRNTKGRINHVGIITDRSSEQILFVHASSSQGIRVDYLETPYYQKRLVGFKRVIPDQSNTD